MFVFQQSNLQSSSTCEAAAAEEVDDEVDHELNNLYERQQRHSEVQAKTSADI